MPRPKRPTWTKITITVSQEISRLIRIRTAELGINHGTFVDQILREHLGLAPAQDPAAGAPRGIPAPAPVPPAKAPRPSVKKAAPPAAKAPASDAAAFAACKGDPPALAEFLYGRLTQVPATRLFEPAATLRPTDPANPGPITPGLFKLAIQGALPRLGTKIGPELDGSTRETLDVVIQSVDLLLLRLAEIFSRQEDQQVIFTPTSAEAFGILVSERLKPFSAYNSYTGAALKVATEISRLVRNYYILSHRTGFAEAATTPAKLADKIMPM